MADPRDLSDRLDASQTGLSVADEWATGAVHAQDGRIELLEETISIGKRVVDSGGVRVSTVTETVEETERVSLEDVVVEVEHVPAGRFVDVAAGPVTDGDLTILPVYEERVVVERRLWLVEEVHIRQRRVAREVDVPVERRRQRAVVERIEPDDGIVPTV